MRKLKPDNITVIQDSREQAPLTFRNLTVEVAALDAGDYSIKHLEHLIACERKSLGDLLQCCGRERDRFKRELQRMRAYRFRLVVVEADAATLERGATGAGWRSSLQPAHVLGSLAAWCAQYDLNVWLAGDHAAAGRFVERWLWQAARCVVREYAAAESLMTSIDSEALPPSEAMDSAVAEVAA